MDSKRKVYKPSQHYDLDHGLNMLTQAHPKHRSSFFFIEEKLNKHKF
jgi:hypothetical protein